MPLSRMAACGVARLDRSDRTLRRVRVLCVGNLYSQHHQGGYELPTEGEVARARLIRAAVCAGRLVT